MGEKRFSWEDETPKKKTAGQAVYDILKTDQPQTTVGEILDEYQHKYVKDLIETVETNKDRYEPPFYVVVLGKKEIWAVNVMRFWFIARQTKPSAKVLFEHYPNHMNTVYLFDKRYDRLEILWSLPSRQEQKVILKRKDFYDPQLVKWILDYRAGKLD